MKPISKIKFVSYFSLSILAAGFMLSTGCAPYQVGSSSNQNSPQIVEPASAVAAETIGDEALSSEGSGNYAYNFGETARPSTVLARSGLHARSVTRGGDSHLRQLRFPGLWSDLEWKRDSGVHERRLPKYRE